ncbi:MAG TPA: oxygenase MpaB family protein [Tepidisphaeraceae bacterium]|jgi:uncharacterized protein (DUF2236 family)|nr:oxygenase MpaB family protein [Tepidisphaeraceae bacterium]
MMKPVVVPSPPLVARADDRVFSPNSQIWKIVRENCILLNGAAAAVLQIAHPRIGLGVRDHSDFRERPIGRLKRTLDAVHQIVFGTHAEADRIANRLRRRHARVRGDAASENVAGPSQYCADEIDLLMWVLATLVMSATLGYERVFGPLSVFEKQAFYEDMRRFGTYFDLPTDYGPQAWGEFVRYYDDVLNDPAIGAHPISREVAWAIAAPDRPWYVRPLGLPMQLLLNETLPSPVRERLGFRSTVASRGCMRVVRRALRIAWPIVPKTMRYRPEYRRTFC